jgi:chromosome segregation ATPase
MSPWEKHQKRGAKHKCTRYACYLTHGDHHPQIMRVARCDYYQGRRKMNKPTKGELHEQINRLKTQEKVLRKALSDRELKIGELRSRIESDKIAFDTRCAREKQIAHEHEVAAVTYAKDCHELKQELEQRLKQVKIVIQERNALKGEVNDLQVDLRLKTDECKEWRDKYQQSQSMVMQLENAIHHHCAEKPDLVQKFNMLNDECADLVKKNSNLRDRLIAKAGQYRDATVELYGYKEQSSRYTESIEKLESQVRTLKRFSELKTKQIEKLGKYKEFFHMLKELQGVDISITTKTKEVK